MLKKTLFGLVFIAAVGLALRTNIETYIIPPDAQLPDGGQYYGALKNGLFDGEGKLIYLNGARYQGHFKQGLFSGFGTLITVTGDRYQGEFVEGSLTGQGMIETSEGYVYQGQIENFTPQGFGRWDYQENSHYVGMLGKGKYHGHGSLVKANGDHYYGYFENNNYEGEGELIYGNGNRYYGQFKKGKREGQGKLVTPEASTYQGIFTEDSFTGEGSFVDAMGNRYEGLFEDWYYHGKGKYSTAKGHIYEGEFADGSLHGTGSYKAKEGSIYNGPFNNWKFEGEGELFKENGDHYQGEFNYGLYHGKGVLTYATPTEGKTGLSGYWQYGRYIGENEGHDPIEAKVEQALYLQNDLIDMALEEIQPSDPGRINLYFVGIGGDGKQNVFYNETSVIQDLFDTNFNTQGRSIIVANNPETVSSVPMATSTSIERVLQGVVDKMDLEQDILFLYFTSHGSDKHDLVINQNGMDLPDLSAKRLGEMVLALPNKWKVIAVSACYSGGLIPELAHKNNLVLTAADYDRRSFGCSDDTDMTYFGRAFFLDALPETDSFIAAFDKAKQLIMEREEEIIKGDKSKHSKPQISKPSAIAKYLKQWRKQLGPIKFAQQDTNDEKLETSIK